ncbi:MAG: helix-turn-helix domain-containing protein [Ahrensia sp.]|nr:helix-turn-helix domain-containing protein [Ahrensia sp.]
MAQKPVPDKELLEALEEYQRCGNKAQAAKNLGLHPNTLKNRIDRALEAAKRGQFGYGPIIPGFEVARVSSQLDAGGNVKSTSILQKPEVTEKQVIPDGHVIKGVSSLIGPDGRTIQSWVKTREGQTSPQKAAEDVQAAFDLWKPPNLINIKPPLTRHENELTVYIANDWHVGLLAWRDELGYSWDLKIAEAAITAAFTDVIESSPPSRRAILLGMGDLLHADNPRNETEASGHKLDVDGRQSQSVEVCINMLANMTTQIAAKHDEIEVVLLPGNHDRNHTLAMRWGLRGLMNLNDRITVNMLPAPNFFHLFGINYLYAAHGDGADRSACWSVMANEKPEYWAAGKVRHAHTAHIHHDTLKEQNGVSVWSHQAPTKRDFWHFWKGFHSGRSIKAFNYDALKGYRGNKVSMLL